MIRNVLLCLLCASVIFANTARSEPSRRGIFVTVIDAHPVLSSRAAIDHLIEDAVDIGAGILFIQIYRSGIAWFPSKVADNSPYQKALTAIGEDPLSYLIRRAHAEGIQVHAWLNMLSLSKNKDAQILKEYGMSILTRNREAKRTPEDYWIDNQYFLEPGDLRVRAYLSAVVEEVLTAYSDLDGIQFDYIRYPDSKPDYGYTTENMARFRKTAQGLPGKDNAAWQDWKRAQVTEFVRQLAEVSRSIRPEIQVSTTGCAPYIRAYAEAFQEWPVWINDDIVDFVTLMSYPADAVEFERNVREAVSKTEQSVKLNIAVPAYKLTKDAATFSRQFDFCESSAAYSCAVFHYGSLLDSPALKEILKNN